MPKIYAGTSGWAYSSWKPDFYPAKLASAKFLGHYATRLNSVEVNYTFRSFPADRLLQNWMAATPAEFKFAIKAHQKITHFKRLRGAAQLATEFIAALEPLEKADKLGPVLFQLPPNLKCDVPLLTEFLAGLPSHLQIAFEFRDESWFADTMASPCLRASRKRLWGPLPICSRIPASVRRWTIWVTLPTRLRTSCRRTHHSAMPSMVSIAWGCSVR